MITSGEQELYNKEFFIVNTETEPIKIHRGFLKAIEKHDYISPTHSYIVAVFSIGDLEIKYPVIFKDNLYHIPGCISYTEDEAIKCAEEYCESRRSMYLKMAECFKYIKDY